MFIIAIVAAIIEMLILKSRSLESLHILQLEAYENLRYKRWLDGNRELIMSFDKKIPDDKSPLVMTDRAKRLYKTHIVTTMAIVFILSFLFSLIIKNLIINVIIAALIIFAIYYFIPYIMLLSNTINKPYENKINMGFYNQAKSKIKSLQGEGLNVIGITGSFGKTSTKFICSQILEEKFNVLNTPSSFNTPMGLSKIINNDLNTENEVFVAELGADKIGEIDEVAKLVQPHIGIITGIGPAHLQSFKSIDNIIKTKYELIEALPPDGIAIFNYDNEYIKRMADKTFKEKVLYGMNDTEKLDIYAKDIEVGEFGSKFTLVTKNGSIDCQTKLLGKHNISNLLGAAAAALKLGMSLEEIKNGIKKTEPIDHRLSLMRPDNGLIIIDDTFNSNPVGFRAALEVLNSFKDGQKIIITPGMVELGDKEAEENFLLGGEISRVCDYAILVGIKKTEPIYNGLIENKFNKNKIFRAKNLDEGVAFLNKIVKAGDVVLFENDLPDNYTEG
ncbi:MAG: UDP-N-acetylmuramoyl-tripeptide--D-alanyl-D-alanine ligase [Tissierellia bacterium]|nr:UDP-N-acetylmuramoyl-tripeptide--D-alanyl-D-alanine ligase [Tissierellia bacterium]